MTRRFTRTRRRRRRRDLTGRGRQPQLEVTTAARGAATHAARRPNGAPAGVRGPDPDRPTHSPRPTTRDRERPANRSVPRRPRAPSRVHGPAPPTAAPRARARDGWVPRRPRRARRRSAAQTAGQSPTARSGTTTVRSRSTPKPAAAAHPTEPHPTKPTHEPARDGPAANASANEVAPSPRMPTVEPRANAVDGRSRRGAGSTGRVRSAASVVGPTSCRSSSRAITRPVSNVRSIHARRSSCRDQAASWRGSGRQATEHAPGTNVVTDRRSSSAGLLGGSVLGGEARDLHAGPVVRVEILDDLLEAGGVAALDMSTVTTDELIDTTSTPPCSNSRRASTSAGRSPTMTSSTR